MTPVIVVCCCDADHEVWIEFVSKLSQQSLSPSTDHQFDLWSVDGESDCRDSLLTNSMQTSWSVDGESDCRDSLLTNSMQTYGR